MTEVHRRCLEEVQNISSKTLFAPVARIDAVQSMSMVFARLIAFSFLIDISSVLVSGWSDNGWLSGGHAVRMALELCWWFALRIRDVKVDKFYSNAKSMATATQTNEYQQSGESSRQRTRGSGSNMVLSLPLRTSVNLSRIIHVSWSLIPFFLGCLMEQDVLLFSKTMKALETVASCLSILMRSRTTGDLYLLWNSLRSERGFTMPSFRWKAPWGQNISKHLKGPTLNSKTGTHIGTENFQESMKMPVGCYIRFLTMSNRLRNSLLSTEFANTASSCGIIPQRHCSEKHYFTWGCTDNASWTRGTRTPIH